MVISLSAASNTKVPQQFQTHDSSMETNTSATVHNAEDQHQNLTMCNATQLASKSSPLQLAIYKKPIRTHSDDDYGCDENTTADNVVLRTKSYSTISSSSATARSVPNAGDRKPYMDRSFSVPMEEKSDGTSSGINQIAAIRSFLESDYIPDEYWHLQRDSFIHRSYNEKLVARKNAQDLCSKSPKPSRLQPNLAQDQIPSTITKKKQRPVSVPAPHPQIIQTIATPTDSLQRYSFIRQSLNSIRRSFSVKSGKHKGLSGNKKVKMHPNDSEVDSGNNNSDNINEIIGISDLLNVPLENVRNSGHSRNSSTSSCASNR